jgi:hypothetical protein
MSADLPPGLGPRGEVGLAYWQTLRRGRRIPSRADLDPTEIPRLLPGVILVDVERQPLDFRYRLVGSDIDSISHRPFRGVRFSEVLHMRRGNAIWAQFVRVADSAAPLWSEIGYVGADPFVSRIRHCLMPLGADGETVDMVFAVVDIDRIAVVAA